MKVNPVKQFVKSNISRFELNNDVRNRGYNKLYNLYDQNNNYRGEYYFMALSSSTYLGVKKALSVTRIMSEKLKLQMQEFVHINKCYVTLKDHDSDILTKAIPSEITTTSTVLDFVNDKYKTVRTVSKLKNKLQRISKDDPDFVYSENYKIYEPLKEKPQYEKSVEYVKEGSISETKKKTVMNRNNYPLRGSINQIPYKFW